MQKNSQCVPLSKAGQLNKQNLIPAWHYLQDIDLDFCGVAYYGSFVGSWPLRVESCHVEHEVSVSKPPVCPVGLDDTSHLVNKEQIVVQYLVLGLQKILL